MDPVSAAPAPSRTIVSFTPSLLALLLGTVAGIIVHDTGSATLLAVRDALEPLGYLWLSALRMVVFPLVVSTLLVAILGGSKHLSAGRIGSAALGTFVALQCVGGLFSVALGSALVQLLPAGAGASISLAPESARALVTDSKPLEFGEWLTSLVPSNPFSSLAGGELLQVIIFTVAFGLAMSRVEGAGRQSVQDFFQAVYQAMMTLVRWILIAAPAAIFILALSFASSMGLQITSILGSYLVMECGLLTLALILLYPLTWVLGGVSPQRFARGVFPAQMVAVSTRSSLASLPALLEGARDKLELKSQVANLVLPLAVSVFKINRPISSMLSLLLLAHLFDIDLTGAQVLTFFVTTLILAFSSAGIPLGGGAMLSLPAYLAVGIPIEGYLLLKTVESIPDIFKTVINVTGDLSVATILNRYF